LRERGFGAFIAHPERSADAALNGAAGLRRELEAGSLAQLNAQSLTGASCYVPAYASTTGGRSRSTPSGAPAAEPVDCRVTGPRDR
ncbi:MAG: hypothetical protein ABW135_04940, partial [Thermoleophilaceae bacterium]